MLLFSQVDRRYIFYKVPYQHIRLHYSTLIKCTLLSKVTYIIKMSVHTSFICFVTFSCVKLSRRIRKKWNNSNSNLHIVCKWQLEPQGDRLSRTATITLTTRYYLKLQVLFLQLVFFTNDINNNAEYNNTFT